MSLTQLFQKKLKLEMNLLHIIDKKPKTIIKLDPLDPEDFIISLEAVKEWSQDNIELYSLILQNGMAEFICNKEYLYQFYKTFQFYNKGLRIIDPESLKFKNLKVLNLTRNNIKTIENIPHNCKELYLDFNQIQAINEKQTYKVQLLSLSNNVIDDASLIKIVGKCTELRCFNVSWNRICKLKEFVTHLAGLQKLKVLIARNNPISLLSIYYTYVTQHLHLTFIDGNKYVKQEPIKEEPKVQEKKEVVKEEKKDVKKDKKGAKVQEKAPEQPKVEVPKVEPKKELTLQDFQKARIGIKITNLQKFSGNIYEVSLFPADIDIKKTQTNYWIKYTFLNESVDLSEKSLTFDSATTQNDEIRLNFDIQIKKSMDISYQNFELFNKGIKIQVYQRQPKMLKDSQTFQLKPEIINGQITIVTSVVCSTQIDLRRIHELNKKQLRLKFLMFNNQVVSNSLFYDPYQDEAQIIKKKRDGFQKQQKQRQLERIKKAEEEQLLKQQKKGGKDAKKAPQKKVAKKEGKEPVATDKKKSQKCDFPIDEKQFCVIDQNKLFKGKQLICVQLQIN